MAPPVAHDEASPTSKVAQDDSPRTRRSTGSLPGASKKQSNSPNDKKSPESPKSDGSALDTVGSRTSTRSSAKKQKEGASPKMNEEQESPQVEIKESYEEPSPTTQGALTAILPTTQKLVTLRVVVNDLPFEKADATTYVPSPSVGHDGNNFYCEICNGVGEIVCCDGCPKVFHHFCLEEGTPSRIALDNDEDPWYCPDCLSENNKEAPSSSRRSSRRLCSECRQSTGPNPILRCERCSAWVHHPSCRSEGNDDDAMDEDSPVLCNNCAAGDVVIDEEVELGMRAPRRRKSIGASSIDDEMSDAGQDDGGGGKKRSKRKRSVDHSAEKSASRKLDSASKERSSVKKRKTKRRRLSASFDEAASEQSGSPIYERPFPRTFYTAPRGLVKATPAFFFFINDHRYKIERALSRKHRYFNRLPKGLERNQLIAREAAIWWVKLRPSEHRRYLKMSMNDFQERVVEWKEENGYQEMGEAVSDEQHVLDGGNQASDVTPEDEKLTYDCHRKLFVDPSVGCRPYVPETGTSSNRLLLELLQDMRFHPAVPMLKAGRSEEEPGLMEYSKMSIPYYEVHGPIATSVGDECFGCSRGWNHFCPVMKRTVPAVENRAKIQGPVSSLMATRVGLGLRPRLQSENTEDPDAEEEWRKAPVFSEKETSSSKEAKKLPPIASYALTHPSARADDVVDFMEAAMAMKVPEPPRPSEPVSRLSRLSRGALPIAHGRKKDPPRTLNKCGRCRAVIQTDSGCIQCRRAQLVINSAKNQTPRSGDSILNVQTAMLGRLSTKDSNFEEQSRMDEAVANAMLKMRWTPNAIMPPRPVLVPEHDADSSIISESASDQQGSRDEDASMELRMDHSYMSDIRDDEASEGKAISISHSNETDSSEASAEDRASRSKRARRETTELFSTAAEEEVEADRRHNIRIQQEEASQLNKRCVSVAACGILLAMLRRDPLLLFAEPVPSDVEAYTKIVTDPIDFGKIKSKVLKDEYKTLAAFLSDARRLCTNALAYNPVGTIYNKTAKELLDVLEESQKRAVEWTNAIKTAHSESSAWRRSGSYTGRLDFDNDGAGTDDDPFRELRKSWPEAVDILESGNWLKSQLAADFFRTKENETAYYGSLAIRRAATAAEASLASYPDTGGTYNPVVRRSHTEDEALRSVVDQRVADEASTSVELKDVPTWREESVMKMLRRVQTRRMEGRIASNNGCARCDGTRIQQEAKEKVFVRWGRNKKKGEVETFPRVAESRVCVSTGMGSSNNRVAAEKRQTEADLPGDLNECIGEDGVSVQGSSIHGWGLFADQPFKRGDVVAEYVGEYVTHATADAREKMYQEQRIQDYQFRADDLVVDATMKGGLGRYINHNCSPNCIAKIVEGKAPNRHLKRVIIIAQTNIKAREEITYDYQFPLELDLDARIPCNCGSSSCRGFMNWDLPEKGSKNRISRGTKRGGNMRDRIRRLNRPRKRDADDF